MFALDVLGGTIQETGLGFDEGDADRRLPADRRHAAYPCRGAATKASRRSRSSMRDHDGSPFFGDPRHVLASVLEAFRALRLTPVVAIELEFYLLDPERTSDGRVQPPRLPELGDASSARRSTRWSDLNEYSAVLAEIAAACEAQQIPSGTALAEYGPGQFEVNLQHSPDALLACDQAIRFKRAGARRRVAARHGSDVHAQALRGHGRQRRAHSREPAR